jgi:hypothetical protein
MHDPTLLDLYFYLLLNVSIEHMGGYCQVGITSPPLTLMILCIAAIAVTNSSHPSGRHEEGGEPVNPYP